MAMDMKGTKPVKPKRNSSRKWTRYLWPVVRQMIIPLVCLIVLFIGMMAGYVKLGGQPLSDVWEWETWKHVFDLVFS